MKLIESQEKNDNVGVYFWASAALAPGRFHLQTLVGPTHRSNTDVVLS